MHSVCRNLLTIQFTIEQEVSPKNRSSSAQRDGKRAIKFDAPSRARAQHLNGSLKLMPQFRGKRKPSAKLVDRYVPHWPALNDPATSDLNTKAPSPSLSVNLHSTATNLPRLTTHTSQSIT